jgi:hypothetical protein
MKKCLQAFCILLLVRNDSLLSEHTIEKKKRGWRIIDFYIPTEAGPNRKRRKEADNVK